MSIQNENKPSLVEIELKLQFEVEDPVIFLKIHYYTLFLLKVAHVALPATRGV